MTIKQFCRSVFLAQQGSISSKRICGVIGWFVCLGVLIYCTIYVIEAPAMIDTIIISSSALLGVDSIANIWKNHTQQNRTSGNRRAKDNGINYKQV